MSPPAGRGSSSAAAGSRYGRRRRGSARSSGGLLFGLRRKVGVHLAQEVGAVVVGNPKMREMPNDVGKIVPACAKIARPMSDIADLFLVSQFGAHVRNVVIRDKGQHADIRIADPGGDESGEVAGRDHLAPEQDFGL